VLQYIIAYNPENLNRIAVIFGEMGQDDEGDKKFFLFFVKKQKKYLQFGQREGII